MRVANLLGKSVVALSLLISLSLSLSSARLLNAQGRAAKSPISITPPAPRISDKERQAELAARRARVSKAIGLNAVLVLFSGEPRVYANDVSYPFRQENNLFYLTNLKQMNATLVLLPGNTPLLFIPRRSPAAETWTGHMYSAEEAANISGISEIWEATEFEPFIKALRDHKIYRPTADKILLSSVVTENAVVAAYDPLYSAAAKNEASVFQLAPNAPNSREYTREQRFSADWASTPAGFTVRSAGSIFSELRLSKSPLELRLLQHAIDISTEAHERAWANAGRAQWEYEVDADVAYIFKLRNADNWGYPDIVGCGPNATTLHYEESQGPVKAGELLLMDVGAEYEHYSADVTRTFPVNGKFSPAQAEIYQIVYDAQEAVAKATKPGATLSDVNRAGTEIIKDGLLRVGLITDRNSMQFRIWFMHGTSHWLGMNVHDVGGGSKFVPGAVFTNEPGIYIRLDALENLPKTPENEKFIAAVRPAFEKYKGIGVRIEDDMLVTETGVQWMTAALPRKLSEIEAFIARARR
ncbi:MAG TPA: Xaa-Pro aminopeptidase [Pyrinomonadaceae bacterium]|nr:Xaa-Pro aminopeptidase [Pyrinomonadaceae bacterium]